MQIRVNGETTQVSETATLSVLINDLALEGKRYAIEVNEEIISRGDHTTHLLAAGDIVEVVQAIGGG